jgi:outer membrane protein assembly factor BamB
MTLTVGNDCVAYHSETSVVCRDIANGDERWRVTLTEKGWEKNETPSLIIYKDTLVYSGGTQNIQGFALADGRELWRDTVMEGCRYVGRNLFVIDDTVWTAEVNSGRTKDVLIKGRHYRTGATVSEFKSDEKPYIFPHHRCYPDKATCNYLLTGRTGIEFVDLKNQHVINHHWVRGECLSGIVPANGLVYSAPVPCACYTEAKMIGYTALSAVSAESLKPARIPPRLEKGPAFGQFQSTDQHAGEAWPTYRHDVRRSGSASTSLAGTMTQEWRSTLGGKLSAPVVAEGKVFVSAIDDHKLHALDMETGDMVWHRDLGGRVDSPPAIVDGLAIFGCRDGYLYALRASDGELAWRLRAGPHELFMVDDGRLESAWPLHGSVTAVRGAVYCVAGRSAFLDGGLILLKVDPATGKVLAEERYDHRDPETSENLQNRIQGPSYLWGMSMMTGLPDIFSADEENIYMRSLRLDPETLAPNVKDVMLPREQDKDAAHLYSFIGFLDDEWMARTFWIYGRAAPQGGGAWRVAPRTVPAGKILVFNDDTIYGFGYLPEHYAWQHTYDYHLFATPKNLPPLKKEDYPDTIPGALRYDKYRPVIKWSEPQPFLVRGMVLAGDTLIAAGPPELKNDPAAGRAAWLGKKGGVVAAYDTSGGKPMGIMPLESPPVFDGMAAAYGKVFVAQMDGSVLCLTGAKQPAEISVPDCMREIWPRMLDELQIHRAIRDPERITAMAE